MITQERKKDQRVSWYDAKISDDEAPVLGLWEMWDNPTLALLPVPLCSGMVEAVSYR